MKKPVKWIWKWIAIVSLALLCFLLLAMMPKILQKTNEITIFYGGGGYHNMTTVQMPIMMLTLVPFA